jgi:hypothetical protein
MTRQPKAAFWRALELHSILDRNYSPRIWEARRKMAIHVQRNIAAMRAGGYLQPDRLPQ